MHCIFKIAIHVVANTEMRLQSILSLGLRSSMLHNFALTALFIFDGSFMDVDSASNQRITSSKRVFLCIKFMSAVAI